MTPCRSRPAGADAREDEYGECLDARSIVNQCREFIRKYGFKEIKLKGGVLHPAIEIETMRALREEFGPACPLRIDPNCAWSVEASCHVGRSLKEELSDGGYLEDPCAELAGMAEVRRRLSEEGIDMAMGSKVAVTCSAPCGACRTCARRPALACRCTRTTTSESAS